MYFKALLGKGNREQGTEGRGSRGSRGNLFVFFPITNHQSPVTSHQSPITNHQSPITNHQTGELIFKI
jgi:hypothetical protein